MTVLTFFTEHKYNCLQSEDLQQVFLNSKSMRKMMMISGTEEFSREIFKLVSNSFRKWNAPCCILLDLRYQDF